MLMANMIKRVLIGRPRAWLSAAVSRIDCLHLQMTLSSTLLCRPVGSHFRRFSCTRIAALRTANSFTCHMDKCDPDTSGKGLLLDLRKCQLPIVI